MGGVSRYEVIGVEVALVVGVIGQSQQEPDVAGCVQHAQIGQPGADLAQALASGIEDQREVKIIWIEPAIMLAIFWGLALMVRS